MVEKRGIKGLSGTSECTGTKATLYRAAPLMGEPPVALRAPSGSPISGGPAETTLFLTKNGLDNGGKCSFFFQADAPNVAPFNLSDKCDRLLPLTLALLVRLSGCEMCRLSFLGSARTAGN